jgi:hypothetical protein
MIIAGVICIILGGVLFYFRSRAQSQLLDLRSTSVSAARELLELARSVAAEIGSGGFQQYASVAGKTQCASPLTSELAQKECVYYSMSVEERYEESYTETDSNGRTQQKTRTSSTTVSNNTRSVPFEVNDDTGAVAVDATHAKIKALKAVDKYEPYQSGALSLSFGGFSFNLSGSGSRRILGYHYSESIIPVGESVYVIGEASDKSGSLVIGQPQEKGKPFIVNCGTKDQVVKSKTTNIMVMMVIGALLLVAGAVLTVVGLVR